MARPNLFGLAPGLKFRQQSPSDHGLESNDDLSRLYERRRAARDCRDDNRFGFGKPVAADRHKEGDGSTCSKLALSAQHEAHRHQNCVRAKIARRNTGIDPEDAMKRVRAVRPGAIETRLQEQGTDGAATTVVNLVARITGEVQIV